MPNFISEHLVKKIQILVRQKLLLLDTDTFCYFNNPIEAKSKYSCDEKVINRVSKYCPYQSESTLSINWYLLKGETLVQIYLNLKNNEFYIYKKIDGKDCKIRLKKNV